MQYKVKDIHESGLELRVPITAAWLAAECPDLDARPAEDGGVMLTGRLERSGEDFLLRADIKGQLVTACARCLEPARVDLELSLAVSFVEQEGADEDEVDDLNVVPFEGGVIDIGPEVRDEILLALPIGPICRADCAGICSICGGNRNVSPCDCDERRRQSASKFQVLSKLKT